MAVTIKPVMKPMVKDMATAMMNFIFGKAPRVLPCRAAPTFRGGG